MTLNSIPNNLSETKPKDSVSKCKQYLRDGYNKYVYEVFKEDSVIEPKEYTPQNEDYFGLSKHKIAWLNVPSLSTIGYKEWMYKINLCLSCKAHDSFEISIGTDSKKANLQFIRLIDNENERKKMIYEFGRLDDNFDTDFFCVQGKAPPRKVMKETSITYRTNKIGDSDLNEIKKNFTYRLNRGGTYLIYPRIRIIKRTDIRAVQIPEIINKIKPLLSFFINFKNKDFKQQQELKVKQKDEKVLNEQKKEEIQRIKYQLQFKDKHLELGTTTQEQIAQKEKRLKELEDELMDMGKIVRL